MSDELKKVEQGALTELVKLRNESSMYGIRANTVAAKFRELLGETLLKMGLSIDDSVLCMACGAVRSTSVQVCPGCSRGPTNG